MFGRSRELTFHSYGRRRRPWRLPRGLVLSLLGLALGAVAVLTVQARYLPARLSADESAALLGQFERADAERQRLRLELAGAQSRLDAALLQKQASAATLADSVAATVGLREDLAEVIAALPPDPRGGKVAVRAGRFTVKGRELEYKLVLTREHAVGKPMAGTVQLLLAGESERGAQTVVAQKPIPMLVGSHALLRGSLPLPAGFKPRQSTIQVFDQPAGKPLGIRVLQIQ